MAEYTGVVIAKNRNGIKVVEGGAWINFTKEEYRGTPFDEVKMGDKVRFTYSESEGRDGGKQTWISVIENLSNPVSGPLPFENNPPEEGFPESHFASPPDALAPSPFVSDAPESTGEPFTEQGQVLWAKDKLRARTDVIACAVGIYKSSIEAGILKEMPTPEQVVSYAATLELWAKSD